MLFADLSIIIAATVFATVIVCSVHALKQIPYNIPVALVSVKLHIKSTMREALKQPWFCKYSQASSIRIGNSIV